jgi:hypothetical protein
MSKLDSICPGDWFASVFPTGEALPVDIGTKRKPCWVIEGPRPSRADIEWSRDVTEGALNTFSARTQNPRPPSVESESGNASGECVRAVTLFASTERGERSQGASPTDAPVNLKPESTTAP